MTSAAGDWFVHCNTSLELLAVYCESQRAGSNILCSMTLPFSAELAVARAAQKEWAKRDIRDRLRHIRNLRALLVDRIDEIGAAIHADIARPAVEIAGTEVLPTTAALKFLEQRAAAHSRSAAACRGGCNRRG